MMTDDVPDGFDTARWLVEEPWSDGGFGMSGIAASADWLWFGSRSPLPRGYLIEEFDDLYNCPQEAFPDSRKSP
jgi:X-Pro dipeptidyl-peptidase (S15 family)